jgi:peptide/nickel transport system ATP-binding protein
MSVDIQGLSIAIGGVPIVRDVDIHIADHSRVGLIGASGSGKSMIARAMMGLLPTTATCSGSIRYEGEEIIGMGERGLADLRGRYVSMVFQNPGSALNPVLTVMQQVMLPLALHFNLSAAQRKARAAAMLAKVGLDASIGNRFPHELSGGQQQRVGIAAALVGAPKLILADEPTTSLDSITQRQIVRLLVSLVDESGASMLFITHDFSVLAHATDDCYVLDAGHIIESGSTRELLGQPRTPQARQLVHAARELTLHADSGEEGQPPENDSDAAGCEAMGCEAVNPDESHVAASASGLVEPNGNQEFVAEVDSSHAVPEGRSNSAANSHADSSAVQTASSISTRPAAQESEH